MKRRARMIRLIALLVSGLVLAAAGFTSCGGEEGEEVRPAQEAADSELLTEARRMIEQAAEPLEFSPPGPPIDVTKVSGKQVLVLSVDQRIPVLAEVAQHVREAGEVAGVNVSIFDAKADPARMQQGVMQATREADAMILLGIPIALVEQTLPDPSEVPSVSVLNNEPLADEPGQGAGSDRVYASTAPSYFKGGQLAAYKAILDTQGEANVVIFNTTEITPAKDVVSGFQTVLDGCAGCKVKTNDTPFAEWSTALTGKAQSEIRRDPEVNYLLPIFDGMALFIVAGVDQAGAGDQVKVASFNATPAALKLIQQGDTFTADPGQPNGWTGWAALDQALRGILDLEPADPEIPLRYFDDSNLQGLDVDSESELYENPDFQAGFKKLWGVE